MLTEDRILLDRFCSSHEIEISFIETLEEHGLIEIIHVEELSYVAADSLPTLEQMVRLYHQLNINPEGIDAINHLLQKIKNMQETIKDLHNKLNFYEKQQY
jgi:hypothetical protein